MTSYKKCSVPLCKNNTIKYPNKLFIYVPKCPTRRQLWLQLARRKREYTSEKSSICFCEDHFDLPNDMENYMQYRIMGYVSQIKLKLNCVPSKFQCQLDILNGVRKRRARRKPRAAVNKTKCKAQT